MADTLTGAIYTVWRFSIALKNMIYYWAFAAIVGYDLDFCIYTQSESFVIASYKYLYTCFIILSMHHINT